MGDPAVVVIFSLIGIIENVIAFKRGKALGCLGLAAGALGFFSTITGSWPVGLMILVGLGLMAFLPGKATGSSKVYDAQAEWQAEREAAVAARSAEFDATPLGRNTATVIPGSNPLANLEVAAFMKGDFDAEVNEIEEDLIQGRIDRATYLERRRALLN